MTFILNPYAFGGGDAFSPPDITGLLLWLKADAIVGLNDGDPVTTWEDSSSANNDFTQSTAGKKPTYQTNEINSLPIVRLDGVDDIMTSPSITGLSDATIFIVAKPGSTGSTYFFWLGSDANAVIWGFVSGKWEWFSTPRTEIGDVSTSDFQIVYTDVGSSVTSAWHLGNYGDGGAFPANADVAEIIVYDSALSGGDQASVQSYLQGKYAI